MTRKCRRVLHAGEIKLIFTRIWFASHVKQILKQAIGLKSQKACDLWVSCRAVEGKIVSVSVQFRFSSNEG